MRKIFVIGVFFIPSILFANPVPAFIVDEFQVAPDSLERIELFWNYLGDMILKGFRVVTSTGTAFVDSNTYHSEGDSFTVFSDSNTSGIFSFNDIQDSIWVKDSESGYDRIQYYTCPFNGAYDSLPAPPIGCSSSLSKILLGFSLYHMGYFYSWDWYIDSTPTFGATNDDYPGCKISGKVFDKDSIPMEGISLYARYRNLYPYPMDTFYYEYNTVSGINGNYLFDSIVPQPYEIYVVPGIYTADTVYGTPRAMSPVESLDIYLHETGIIENSYINAESFKIISNPIRTGTYLEFSISKLTPIELSIYDISGSLVKKLLNENKSPGKYKTYWDATGSNGSKLNSGVYFCRLKAGTHTLTKKLILI